MDTWVAPAEAWTRRPERANALVEPTPSFEESFARLFRAHHTRLYRFLQRLSGDPELAADVAQDAYIRLFRRGSLPHAPEAWLISVALNLFRNASSTRSRRTRLLTAARAEVVHSDPLPAPDESATAGDARSRVRAALARMPDREQRLLLLRGEGYSYRDIAAVLQLNEASVGTLLARARRAFLAAYGGRSDAP